MSRTVDVVGKVAQLHRTMDFNFITAILILCAPIIYTLMTIIKNKYLSNYPPSCGDFIPWMGCGIQFGKSPLHFIEQKRKQLGAVFTLKVTGKRLTFLTHYSDFKHFFKSQNVDFQKGVQDAVKHAASISPANFLDGHKKMHDMMKGKLARVSGLSSTLCTELEQCLDELPSEGSMGLLQMIRELMYRPSMNCLFGKDIVVANKRELYKQFESHFINYDYKFQYGSQMPEFLVRSWAKSKAYLLNTLRQVVKNSGDIKESEQMTVLQSVLSIMDPSVSPNFSMMVLWAALANAIPMTFWVLSFILSNPDVEAKVREEVEQVIGPYHEGMKITDEHVHKLHYIKRCLYETIRLRSPGVIMRKVCKPFTVRGYTVPAGDLLMVSPYWAHRNPEIFTNPDTFDPSRWRKEELEKSEYREGFVPFGGGRYQCPGRWFAMLEVQMTVALILSKYNLKLNEEMAGASYMTLIGSQQPNKHSSVSYQMKEPCS